MAKFRYIILGLDGSAPEGTDDDLLAHFVADHNDEVWVIDTEEGLLLGLQGDEDNELAEADPADHDYEAPDDGEADGDGEAEDGDDGSEAPKGSSDF
jgi:hypothetical protein